MLVHFLSPGIVVSVDLRALHFMDIVPISNAGVHCRFRLEVAPLPYGRSRRSKCTTTGSCTRSVPIISRGGVTP